MAEGNIFEKLRKVQMELKAPKDQKGRFGLHRNAEGILKAVKPLNHEHGITLVIDGVVKEVGGRTYQVAIARATLDGQEWAQAEGWAWEGDISRGLDAPQVSGAANSYARKYALGGLYDIDDSTDDPDSHMAAPASASARQRQSNDRVEYATATQWSQIFAQIKGLGIHERDSALAYLADSCGIDDPEHLTQAEAKLVIAELSK